MPETRENRFDPDSCILADNIFVLRCPLQTQNLNVPALLFILSAARRFDVHCTTHTAGVAVALQ